ncbi:hypothetical protein CRX67_02420 [Enterobacteriaceae bacterium A-F18]|nr:hypothetical protein C2U55_27755 [Enterobacteriaceae bacterium ENNIH3]AUV03835.1 hypothetical protein C2U51_24305 [Enterobacteriaceae bacterium ENNIH1]AUV07373.1 hypothetical protein C2U52_14350 [Enterobacteriaceae bacterium ENNIH2]PTA94346.1 hypothetical protein C9415_16575 [Kluyvera sp. Nf5]PWF53949.1 hypothetical protein BHT19_0024890 [[Kluyvera] intestini]QIH62095.1 hypothetical protein CRX67_02420 [Enterobacteriaceae bacterium A-F18]RDT52818.1 hypothetical protein DXF93_19705 [Escheri
MLRVQRKQSGRWDLSRHASLCSSKQKLLIRPVSAIKAEEKVRLTAGIITIKERLEIINNQKN